MRASAGAEESGLLLLLLFRELALNLGNLAVDFLVRNLLTIGCEFERHDNHAAYASRAGWIVE